MNTNPVDMPADINRKPSKNSTAFPSTRYFQVHFEYLHELMGDMKKQLDVSNQKITQLQQQLSEFIPTVSEEHNKKH